LTIPDDIDSIGSPFGAWRQLEPVNNVRLQKSLQLLRDLNRARLAKAAPLISKYEAILRQHDYDGRDKIDSRQLSIFDHIFKT
jgi:hypothetical protein